MQTKFKFLLIIGFFAIVSSSYSQNTEANKQYKYYTYTFSGTLSFDAIEQMKSEILNMQFVTEVKIEYKAEKKAGQIRLLTAEYYTNKDTEFEFNIYNLKQMIIRYNAEPNQYKSEPISK